MDGEMEWEGWLCRVQVGVDDNTEQDKRETQESAFVRNVRLRLGFSLGRLYDVDSVLVAAIWCGATFTPSRYQHLAPS